MTNSPELTLAAGDRSVPWLHRTPPHWRCKPLKYLAQINVATLSEETDPGFAFDYIDIGNVNSEGVVADKTSLVFADAPSRARRVLATGDVFISTVRTYLTAIGYCDETHSGSVCSTGFAVLTPGVHLDPKLLFYWVRSANFVSEIVARSTGVSYPAINASEIGNLPCPVLPQEQQQAIANFLDRKTARIDGVIAQKRRMIGLLHEKRRAVISEAVTRGLDPAAPTKDSGVEWLGRVPEHWRVEPLRHSITKIEQGWSPQCDNRPADDGEWGVLKVGCGNGDEFDPTEQKALPLDVAPMPDYEIKPGDILMSRGNTRELVGAASLVRDARPRLMICDLLYRFRALPRRADPEFLVFALRSPLVRFQIEREATGTSPSMKKIGQETIRELLLCVPPLDEQRAVVARLTPLLARHDQIVRRIEAQIGKLREYRQAVISAAVTGQIDVSKEAAPC